MKQTRILMGMPITLEIRDETADLKLFDEVFEYFEYVDQKFSTYKDTSEISAINRGEISPQEFSADMREVFEKSAETKKITNGFFDIQTPSGTYDPSGLVKGWAILKASELLKNRGAEYFFIDAGGDIQASVPAGVDGKKTPELPGWTVGIRNPFNSKEIVKVLNIKIEGVATSGTYIRGQHIYDPHQPKRELSEVVSITVIGPNIYEADRFATAAFAMGINGVEFIEKQKGLEAYQIDATGTALMTAGFSAYAAEAQT